MKIESEKDVPAESIQSLAERFAIVEEFRQIVRHELDIFKRFFASSNLVTPPGLNEMPMYKIDELCQIFRISKPTIYEWIRKGELRPIKIRSRVFFLSGDIKSLIKSKQEIKS